MNDAFGRPQSVVVLGGTSDIARCVIERLAPRCRTVVLAGRDTAGLESAAKAAQEAGAESAKTVQFDATDPGSAEAAVAASFGAAGGPPDLVLVAVGTLGDQDHDERAADGSTRTLMVNFTWPAAALSEAGRLMRDAGHGRIVVLSSVAGVRVRRANYVYGSAKAGLDGYALGLGEALRGSGVSVQVVRPGFVTTKMTAGMSPAPFATTPEAVADAIVDELQRDTAVVWVPGVLRWVFAVLRQLPASVWRRLPG